MDQHLKQELTNLVQKIINQSVSRITLNKKSHQVMIILKSWEYPNLKGDQYTYIAKNIKNQPYDI